jgi:hypothetical protein
MAGNLFEIWLGQANGKRLQLLDTQATFSYSKVVNGVGWFNVNVPGESINPEDLTVDNTIQVWRSGDFTAQNNDFWGFLRHWQWNTTGDGLTTLTLSGPDQNDILNRRIVAYNTAETEGTITDTETDDAMKDVFNENFIGGAYDSRDISGNNVTVSADTTEGAKVTLDISYKNALNALQDLNKASRADGNEVFFWLAVDRVDNDGVAHFDFRTSVNQPGTDRTTTSLDHPTIFSLEFGNLGAASLTYDYVNEINYFYVGSSGTGASRAIKEVFDLSRINASIWNRREGFKSANAYGGGGIRAIGKAALDEHRPRVIFTGDLLEAEQTPFGSWEFGDKVTVVYNNLEFDVVVRSLTVAGSSSGLTQSGSGISAAFRRLSPFLISINSLDGRLNDLELIEVA